MNRVIQGILAIGSWYAIVYFDTCVVYRIIWKSSKAIDRLVVMQIDFCIFNFCTTFDIDVNGGESDMKKLEKVCTMGRNVAIKYLHEDLSDEEILLVFLELDVSHLYCHQCQRRILLAWMLMLWGSIEEQYYDCVYHWWQHRNKFGKDWQSNRLWFLYWGFILLIYLCIVNKTSYSTYSSLSQVCRT